MLRKHRFRSARGIDVKRLECFRSEISARDACRKPLYVVAVSLWISRDAEDGSVNVQNHSRGFLFRTNPAAVRVC